jgi:hypothetical protein
MAVQRHHFSGLQIDAVLTAVANGQPLLRACEVFGADRKAFYRLLNTDAELARKYALAVQQQTAARFGANAIDCNEG